MKKIILVFKTHVDIGFTGLASEIIEKYSTKMLSDVVEMCESTQGMGNCKYVWTMPSWVLTQALNPELAPREMIKRAEAFIENNQIAWHALPFTTHTEFCGLEEYIRAFDFSKLLCERYGKKVVSAKMTDVYLRGYNGD